MAQPILPQPVETTGKTVAFRIFLFVMLFSGLLILLKLFLG